MKPTDFQRWLTQADELTPFQRERSLETLTSQNPERACADVIEERVADERRCPRCDMPGATRHGMANGLQRYRCDPCRRTFNALTAWVAILTGRLRQSRRQAGELLQEL